MPTSTSTLVDLLCLRAQLTPERLVFRFLVDGQVDGPTETLDFSALDARARAVAAMLQQEGLAGHPALLLHPVGLEYVVAFFGCLYAGVIPVPAYPPDLARKERSLPHLMAILEDCQAPAILTVAAFRTPAEGIFSSHFSSNGGASPLKWIATDRIDPSLAGAWKRPSLHAEDVAFLQYTSGSTSTPKGVMVTHRNLMMNSAQIQRAFQHDESTSGAFWLPPYHDMGLIGGILQPVYAGMSATILSPMAFLQRPMRWLEAISRYGATTAGGPNFAFDLCARKAKEQDNAGLDLSRWRVAFNGAEPVRGDTLERFAKAFEPCGFHRRSLHPCYGLAEGTLLGAFGRPSELPATLVVDAEALSKRVVREASEGSPLVSSGAPLPGEELRIVDPETRLPAPPDRVGEIWLRGASVARGYWERPEATREAFGAHLADSGEGPFLRTGDLGFLHDGLLYVTGRAKDVIIIRGRNLWPQDVERTVEECHSAIRPGAVAAFAVEQAEGEGLSVLAEITGNAHPVEEIAAAIRRAIMEAHGVAPVEVALADKQRIPKTSSGKIQRSACREGLADGAIQTVYRGRSAAPVREEPPAAGLGMSLFFFSADAEAEGDVYGLFLESVRAADRLGFDAIWIPERHFHPFGGLYPNPAVLASAAAVATTRVRIRAGSVVLPLHDPLRVAEEWAVVDRLSGGRVDLAFAVGWNPNDFALAPQAFERREELTFTGIETLRRLWKGEAILRKNGAGAEVPVRVFPRPRQSDIAIWLTCSGGPGRFVDAGRRGFHVLTALLFQTPEELAVKVALYRQARADAGFDPATGRVTLMLHTFVGADEASIMPQVRRPLEAYLETSVDLWRQEAESLDTLSPEARQAVLDYAVERYCRQSALIGTPQSCAAMLARVKAAGVDEVACLIDFGVAREAVVSGLARLSRVRDSEHSPPSQPAPLATAREEVDGAVDGARHAALMELIREETAALLGAPPEGLGADTELVSLGIDSVKAVELCGRLGTRVGRALPVTLLFDHPTLSRLATFLRLVEENRPLPAVGRLEERLLEDAILPEDLRADGKPTAFTASPRDVLLTGATGFLGAFLLHELLTRTDATIHCLVRASTPAQGTERLVEGLREYGLWDERWRPRVAPLIGDLASPGLGLGADTLEALAHRIEAIYHNGALVNFAYRYSACRAPNVGGTLDVLRLSSRGPRLIPVHHVSTTAIFSHHYADRVVTPEDIPEDISRLDMGYAQSKWVADKLVRRAMERGLPISIYRPGLITGSAATGACHLTNFAWNLIRVSVEIGAFPDYPRILDMIPVDWATRAIVRCSLAQPSLGQTFHLVNQRPVSIPDLGRWFASRGYAIRAISFEAWQLRLFERVTTTAALSPLLPILGLAAADFYEQRQVHFDSPLAAAPFVEAGMPCPPVDDALLDAYLAYFVGQGFLPSASRPAPSQALSPALALDAGRLHGLVEQITGLHVPPHGFWREPMEILLDDMRRSTTYSPEGLARASARMVTGLIRHARMKDLRERRPEISQIPIERPVIIVSPPRTGTTLLHNLLAQDPDNRTISLWEMMAPVSPAGAGTAWEPHMAAVAEEYLEEVYTLAPALRSIHPMAPRAPDECQWLLGNSFTAPVFTLITSAPHYAKWLLQADMLEAYTTYRGALQGLLWRKPGQRLVLKCPGHLWHLDALLEALPDAVIVQIHRNMKDVVPSVCSLAQALQSVETRPPPARELGRTYLDWLDAGVQRMLSVRRAATGKHFVDLHYADLVKAPLPTLHALYSALGRSLSTEAEAHMRGWLGANPKDKHGVHRYRLDDFALDGDEVRERFEAYTEAFLQV